MRRLLTAVVVLVGLFPLSAMADECVATTIERDGTGPYMGELVVDEDVPVRVEIVGTFLWWARTDQVDQILSVEIPADAVGFTACESGEVTFTRETPSQPVTGTTPGPVESTTETVNIVDVWRPWFAGSAV